MGKSDKTRIFVAALLEQRTLKFKYSGYRKRQSSDRATKPEKHLNDRFLEIWEKGQL